MTLWNRSPETSLRKIYEQSTVKQLKLFRLNFDRTMGRGIKKGLGADLNFLWYMRASYFSLQCKRNLLSQMEAVYIPHCLDNFNAR